MIFKNIQKNSSIEDQIRECVASNGWDISYQLRISREDINGSLVNAYILNNSWVINITLDNNFEKKVNMVNTNGEFNYSEPNKKIAVSFLPEHEMNHWRICPSDIIYTQMLLDSISKGLKTGGLDEDKISGITPYVANMFADIVINTIGSSKREYTEGFMLSYEYVLKNNNKNQYFKLFKNNDNDLYFQLFCDIQAKLFGNNLAEKKLAEKYISDYNDKGKKGKGLELLSAIIGAEDAKKAYETILNTGELEKIRDKLGIENYWKISAYDFAKALAPLIKDQEKEDMCENVPLSGPLKEFEENQEYRKKVLNAGVENNSDMLYAEKFEAFDEIYKKKAGTIIVELPDCGSESSSLTLFNMGKKSMSSLALSNDIDWKSTLIINGEAQLYEKELPFNINLPGAKITGSMQDLLFIIDTSGSMGWSGNPLDGSKYDMCLRSVYSVIKYLQKIEKAAYINYGLILFSNTTSWTGWTNYYEFEKIKKSLFTGYQNGDSQLQPDVIRTALRTKKDKFLTIMISDGELNNASEAISPIKDIITDGNDLTFIQVASRDNFANEVERSGGTVINVDNPEDILNLSISITKRKYAKIKRD